VNTNNPSPQPVRPPWALAWFFLFIAFALVSIVCLPFRNYYALAFISILELGATLSGILGMFQLIRYLRDKQNNPQEKSNGR